MPIPSWYINNATPTLKTQGTSRKKGGTIVKDRGPESLLEDNVFYM